MVQGFLGPAPELLDELEFKTKDSAEEYIIRINSKNNSKNVPKSYVVANLKH